MTNDEIKKMILIEVHRMIQEAATNGVSKLGQPFNRVPTPVFTDDEKRYITENKAPDLAHPAFQKFFNSIAPSFLNYPPKDILTEDEEKELCSLRLSEVQRSALPKLIADSCASAFFSFFCLLDAVGDPEVASVDH